MIERQLCCCFPIKIVIHCHNCPKLTGYNDTVFKPVTTIDCHTETLYTNDNTVRSRLPLIVIHTVQIHTPSRYRKHCFPKITLPFYRTNTHAVRQLFSDPVYLHGIDYRTHTQTTMRPFSTQMCIYCQQPPFEQVHTPTTK